MILDQEQSATETIKLSDKEIFIKIWTSPREVFKYINDNKYDKFVHILLVLAGIAKSFDKASENDMGDNLPLLAVIAFCVFLGGLFGWISYFIYAALLRWTGKWLNGKGDTESLLRMISHAMIPSICVLVLLIPQILLFGNGIFKSELDAYGGEIFLTIVLYSSIILEMILGIWTLVIFVIGLSEIQKLSIGKSILNMILPVLIIIVPIALVAFILGDLFK